MRKENIKAIAICGVTTGLAVVIMSLGTLIPFATYVCPVLCILLGNSVYYICKVRFAWTWYAAVTVLSCILCPDKEAVVLYLLLGYYPYIKKWIDRSRFRTVLKLIFFNVSACLLYTVVIFVLGVSELREEFRSIGMIGAGLILLLANFTFFLLDRLLSRIRIKY